MIDEEKWFINLLEKGNIGLVVLFIMLDEFMVKDFVKLGD